jgi:hypothetical protein
MSDIWVEFSDGAKTTVVTVYPSGLGDAENHPLAMQVPSTDTRYAAYYDSIPASMRSGLTAPGE